MQGGSALCYFHPFPLCYFPSTCLVLLSLDLPLCYFPPLCLALLSPPFALCYFPSTCLVLLSLDLPLCYCPPPCLVLLSLALSLILAINLLSAMNGRGLFRSRAPNSCNNFAICPI